MSSRQQNYTAENLGPSGPNAIFYLLSLRKQNSVRMWHWDFQDSDSKPFFLHTGEQLLRHWARPLNTSTSFWCTASANRGLSVFVLYLYANACLSPNGYSCFWELFRKPNSLRVLASDSSVSFSDLRANVEVLGRRLRLRFPRVLTWKAFIYDLAQGAFRRSVLRRPCANWPDARRRFKNSDVDLAFLFLKRCLEDTEQSQSLRVWARELRMDRFLIKTLEEMHQSEIFRACAWEFGTDAFRLKILKWTERSESLSVWQFCFLKESGSKSIHVETGSGRSVS